jgi:hypothetical protein
VQPSRQRQARESVVQACDRRSLDGTQPAGRVEGVVKRFGSTTALAAVLIGVDPLTHFRLSGSSQSWVSRNAAVRMTATAVCIVEIIGHQI